MFKLNYGIKKFISKALAHFLAVMLTLSNGLTAYARTASIVPDSSVSGNKVYLDKSANHLPVVNINDPNGAGVSHNHFTDFNVGTQGAIINNSAVNAVSQIGGVVTGNANLTNSASTIINEVTGSSRSHILGPQEILGKSADYILANPNGISVNGGEFINAQSATFTTGKVLLDSSGMLEKFLIEKGDVEIDGKQIDLSNLDYFDIIARSVKLNTAIYAKRNADLSGSKDTEVNVVVGAGQYNVKSKTQTAKHSNSAAPSFSIDSSSLGGLYAGKIRLVSTEAGVGVNLPNMHSTTGDIEITADGKIVHKNIASANRLKVTSNNDKIVVKPNKGAHAQGNIEYLSKKNISIKKDAAVASEGSIKFISSDGVVKNQGIISSQGKEGISIDAKGAKNHNTILTGRGTLGSISINSRDAIENSGTIKTDLGLSSTFQNGFRNSGTIISKTLTYRGDDFTNTRDGQIHVQNSPLVILAEGFNNTGSITNSNEQSRPDSPDVQSSILAETSNSTMPPAGKSLIALDGVFSNAGKIYAAELDVTARSGKVINSGTVKLPKIKLVASGGIENSDTIETSMLDITSTAGGLSNSGTIKSLGAANITIAGNFSNESGLLFTDKDLTLNTGGELLNDSQSRIVSKGSMSLKATGKVDNAGHIKAKEHLSAITDSSLDNSGNIQSDSNIVLTSIERMNNAVSGVIKSLGSQKITSKSEKIKNSGTIISAKDATIDVYRDFTNTGDIVAVTAPLQITSRTQGLVNSGKVIAPKITITGKNNIRNSDIIETSILDITSTAGGLSNSGTIKSLGTANITIAKDFTNAGGLLFTDKDLTLNTGGELLNDSEARIVSKSGMSLKATGKIDNKGHIEAKERLSVITDSSLDNSGNVLSDSNIILTSIEDMNNAISGVIKSIGSQTVTSQGKINNQGKIKSKDGSVTLSTNADIENAGKLVAKKDIKSEGSQNILNSGSILASRVLDLSTLGKFTNTQDANIGSIQDLTIVVNDGLDNQGEILALDGITTIKSGKNIINREGGNITGALGAEITADKSITNSGSVFSSRAVDINAEETIHNTDKGQIGSGQKLSISSGTEAITNDGIIGAVDDVLLESARIAVNNGHILSGKAIEVNGETIENRGQINAVKSIKLSAKDDITNIDAGLIKSGGELTITSREGHVKNINSDPVTFNKSGIIAVDKATIDAALGFTNNKAHIQSGKSLEILTKGSFLNDSGNMIAGELLTLRVDGDLENLNGGAIQGIKGVRIRGYDNLSTSKSLTNAGSISAGFKHEGLLTIPGTVDILTKEAITNTGVIQAVKDVSLEVTEGKLQNKATILAQTGAVTAKAYDAIDNSGLIASSGDISLVSLDKSMKNSGDIISISGVVALKAKTKLEHSDGSIKAKNNIGLTAETEGVTINNKIVSTDADLKVTSYGDISSTGTLQASGDIAITAANGRFHNNAGNVLADNGKLNIRALSVKNDSTAPNNGYLQGNELQFIATARDIENAGVMHSKIGGEVVAKNSVINSQNIELGNAATITATDKDVTNTGLILSTKALSITAADTVSNRGQIKAPELTLKNARLIDNKAGSGITSSDKVTMVNTRAIQNAGLIDFGRMEAISGINSVTNPGTLKGNSLSITAPTFSNTGRTELTGAANLQVTSLTSNILTAGANSNITVNGNYTNTGKLQIDGADLNITANSITNNSGAVLKAGKLTATATSGAFSNAGMFFGKNGVKITAPTISNASTGYLISGTTLDLTGTTTNHGGISSGQNLNIRGTLDNRGDLRTQRTLDIQGATTNYGRLAGSDKVGITGNLTNSGSVVSNNNVTVTGGSNIYNSGTMTSRGSMDLNNATLTNTNVLEAVGNLSTSQSGNISNSSSIYGGTINLRSTGGSITNDTRIIARNNLYLRAAGDVINKDQITLTGTGTLSITAGGNIRNDRQYQIVRVDTGNLPLYMPIAPSSQIRGEEVNRGSYHDQVLETIITTSTIYRDSDITIDPRKTMISSGGNITLNARELNNTTGSISARNNITISGSNLINADIVRQEHVHNQREIQQYIKKRKWDWKGKGSWTEWGPYFRPGIDDIDTNELRREPSLIQAGGSITGNLSGSVTLGSAESGGSKSGISAPYGGGVGGSGNYAQMAAEPQALGSSGSEILNKPISGTRSLEVINTEAGKFTSPEIEDRQSLAELSRERLERLNTTEGTTSLQLAQISMDNASLKHLALAIADSYALPTISSTNSAASSSTGRYVAPTTPEVSWQFDDPEITQVIAPDIAQSKGPGRYWIPETSTVFTDMGTYFSTDNFIKRIEGFAPKKQDVGAEKLHFGDSMKQMDFVRRQMAELTGHATLEDSIDYAEEIRKLYETGIRYGKDMQLSAGVALTEQQVDALQDDMVWVEEIELRGSKVVVPRLYAAKSKRGARASGLLARNINIDAGSIKNRGSGIVGENVQLTTRKGDIVNEDGGDIYASGHLGMNSARDIRNVASSITSDGSANIHAARNIENITQSERFGDDKNHTTKVGKQATIKVKGPLSLVSGGNLINKGSSIESGDLEFAIGGNMINESIEVSESVETLFSGGHYKKKSIVYRPATITSSGLTQGYVAGNFALIGSRMNITGDSNIHVDGNSFILSQVNSDMLDRHSESTTTGMFGGDKDHVDSHKYLRETLAESAITAGGKNVLINKGDQTLQGASIYGGKGTFLKGRKTSVLATQLRNMQSDYEYDEGTVFNSTDADGHDNITQAHSSISSGSGEVVVDSDAIELDYTSKVTREDSDSFSSIGTGLGWGNNFSASNKPSWAKKLESEGRNVQWNPLTNSYKEWSVHQQVLNPEFSAIVSISAALATMYAGGFGLFGSAGATGGTAAAVATNASMLSTMGTAMGQAALTGMASKASVSMLNNNFDLGKVAGDLTSKESLKGLGLNVLTTGLTAGVGHGLGIDQLAPGMDMAQRAKIITQQGLINGAVRTGLAGATGEDLGKLWKEEALSGGLALGQSKIGDISQDKGLKTGSFGKVAMHSLTGGIYSAATGASPISGMIGGAGSELIAGIMESGKGLNGPPSDKPLTTEQAKINADQRIKLNNKIKATAKLVSATTTLLAGGSAKDINITANVAESAVKHNRRLHPSEEQILAELQKGKTLEEQRRLELAAKSMVRASAGVSKKDNQYSPLSADELEGSKYVKEQQMLRSAAEKSKVQFAPLKDMEEMYLAEGLGGNPGKYTQRTFDYNGMDKVEDIISSKGEEGLYRTGQVGQALLGSLGTVAMTAGAFGVEGYTLGLGTPEAIALASGAYLSYEHTKESIHNITAPYQLQEGLRVQESFKTPVSGSYISERGSDVAMSALVGIGGGKVLSSTAQSLKKNIQAFRSAPEAEYRQLQHEVEQAVNNYNRIAHKNGNSVINPSNRGIETHRGVNYQNFSTTQWTSPSGTKQTYKVHQRDDINWDMVRINPRGDKRFIGKTNREAALAGHRPELSNGKFVTTHHVGQNSKGPIVEASTEFHDFSNPKAFRSLHNQHGVGNPHPEHPVNQQTWNKEQKEYWKWRIKNAE